MQCNAANVEMVMAVAMIQIITLFTTLEKV
jgi:hypothetical protein